MRALTWCLLLLVVAGCSSSNPDPLEKVNRDRKSVV